MSSYLTAVWKRGGQRECGALTEAELLALVHEAMSTELREATSRRPEDAMLRIIGGASGDARCDEVLLHFLHASGDDPVKAERLFRQALQWRAEQQLERAPANIFMTSGVHMPVCACGDGLGSTGEVLTYTAAGLLAKPLDLQLLEKAIGVWFDRLLYTPQPEGYQASSVFAVVDFKGFSVSQVDIHALKLGILSYMRYYPGIFRRICLVNYPVAIYGSMFCFDFVRIFVCLFF